MHTYQHLKIAEDFELPRQYVINCRRRYLTDELELLDLEMAFYDDYRGNLASEYFAIYCYADLALQRSKVKMELRKLKTSHKPLNGITDEDIDMARCVPITSVVEFVRGKAIAFCHEDRNPSMYHATRLNLAICPVCDKKFDTIGVLMERDGLKFYDAIKQLI